jgi:hypothetical protein
MVKTFWTRLWKEELEDFLVHITGDFVETFCILAVLLLFWAAVRLLKALGYADDLLDALEKTHFAFMYRALLVLGFSFVAKLAFSLKKRKKV